MTPRCARQNAGSTYQKASMNYELSSSLERGPSSPTLDPRLPIVSQHQPKVQVDDSTKIIPRRPPSGLTLNASLSGVPPITTTFLETPRNPGPILQPHSPSLHDLAKLENERDLYRSEMVSARNGEGRLRAQRDQYKALRNDAVQKQLVLEKQVATLTEALEEQRKLTAKAQESLRAAESEKDEYIRALKESQEALAHVRRSWVDEKKELNKALLMAQRAQLSAEDALSRASKQARVAQKQFKHHLAVSREQTIDVRRSLAEVERQASDALGMIRNDLEDARREKENLVQAKDRLAVELSKSQEEVGSLRQSLIQAMGRESESSEALRKLQKHSEDREETLTNAATALRTSLAEKKAAYKKTKKQLVDALETRNTLEGKIIGLNVSLARARKKESEAVNELADVREEHEETVVSLRKAQSTELWLWMAEIGRLRLALDDANEAMEDQQEDHAVQIATLRTSLVEERERHKEVEEDAQETWEGSEATEEPQEVKSDSDGEAPLPLGFVEDSDEAEDSDEEDDEETGHQGSDHETDSGSAPSDGEMHSPLGVAEDNGETPDGSESVRERKVGGDASEASVKPSRVGYWLSRRARGTVKRTCPQPEASDRPTKVRRYQ